MRARELNTIIFENAAAATNLEQSQVPGFIGSHKFYELSLIIA